jgi:hypothetical protein
MFNGLKAGGLYAAIVFSAGFVVGVLRVTQVTPRLGPVAAVLLEAPVMIGISWFVAREIIRRLAVTRRDSLVMGLFAFVVAMGLELAFSVWLFGGAPNRFLGDMLKPAGLIGLATQFTFGAVPLFQRAMPGRE